MENAVKGKKNRCTPKPNSIISDDEVKKLKRKVVQLEEAKRILQAESEQIFRHAGHGIRVINRDSTIRYINQAFSEMFGGSPAEAIGKECWEIFPSPLCRTAECRLKRILNGETMVQAEIERTKRDGTTVPCIVNAVPLYSDKGATIGVIETFTDITEKLKLERKVKEYKDLYQTLVQLGADTGEAITILQDVGKVEGKYIFVNDLWPKITGYTREELLKLSAFDLISLEHRDAARERYRIIISGTLIPKVIKTSVISKSGDAIPIELTIAPITYQGKRSAAVHMRDISEKKRREKERRESEKRYLSLFEHAPTALWEMDFSLIKNHIKTIKLRKREDIKHYFNTHESELLSIYEIPHVVRHNRAALELYEANLTEGWSEQMRRSLVLRSGQVELFKDYLAALYEGFSTFQVEATITTFKGNKKNIQFRYTLPPSYEDTWGRVFISSSDITQLKTDERKLRASESRLKLLSKKIINAQELEGATIARDLHDSLGQELVSSRLEALALAQQSKDLGITNKAIALADQIAGIAISVQQLSFNLRPLLLDSVGFVQAIKMYSGGIERKTGISCSVTISNESIDKLNDLGESAVTAYRIIQEALTNVVKHSQATQAEVNISIKANRLILCISDNGTGIRKQKLKEKESLGLIGMRERAMMLRGTLSICSRLNEGTKITAYLPIK